MLAQITGKPILPIAVAHSLKFTFRTWDSFELPLPFSRVAIVYGEPVFVGRVPTPTPWRAHSGPAERLLALMQARAALSREVVGGQVEFDDLHGIDRRGRRQVRDDAGRDPDRRCSQ